MRFFLYAVPSSLRLDYVHMCSYTSCSVSPHCILRDFYFISERNKILRVLTIYKTRVSLFVWRASHLDFRPGILTSPALAFVIILSRALPNCVALVFWINDTHKRSYLTLSPLKYFWGRLPPPPIISVLYISTHRLRLRFFFTIIHSILFQL